MNHIIPVKKYQFQLLSLEMQQEYIDFKNKYPVGSEAFVFDDKGLITGPMIILGVPQLYAGEDYEDFDDLVWIVGVGRKIGDKPEYYFITNVFTWEEE